MAQLSSTDVPTSLASICSPFATDDGVPDESILLAGTHGHSQYWKMKGVHLAEPAFHFSRPVLGPIK